jgi:hypothetical protein
MSRTFRRGRWTPKQVNKFTTEASKVIGRACPEHQDSPCAYGKNHPTYHRPNRWDLRVLRMNKGKWSPIVPYWWQLRRFRPRVQARLMKSETRLQHRGDNWESPRHDRHMRKFNKRAMMLKDIEEWQNSQHPDEPEDSREYSGYHLEYHLDDMYEFDYSFDGFEDFFRECAGQKRVQAMGIRQHSELAHSHNLTIVRTGIPKIGDKMLRPWGFTILTHSNAHHASVREVIVEKLYSWEDWEESQRDKRKKDWQEGL